MPLETLHRLAERHLRCNPALAQYVVDPAFAPVACDGPFAKSEMGAQFVAAEENRVSRGYRRLLAIPPPGLAVPEHPLAVTPVGEPD